jgi:hypothetical protein
MAVNNRNSLVLNGVCVVRDVVTSTMGFGFNQAWVQAPAIPFTLRHPSQRYPQAEREPGQRHDHADGDDVDDAADRAGRPGCRVGVLASRSPALRVEALGRGQLRLPCATEARKHARERWTWLKPAGAALPTSTRGS